MTAVNSNTNEATNTFLNFIAERHAIYTLREAGKPKPWTNDDILKSYRFCNVYRELDTVTRWIATNIRDKYEDHPNLWFMLALARRINWPDTLQEIMDEGGWPKDKYDPEKLRLILDARTARKEKVYTGAYMITTEHIAGETKSRTTAFTSLGKLWERRKFVNYAHKHGGYLFEIYDNILGGGFAWGSFMTAQVIADLKYAEPYLKKEDWWDFVASGPGSRRGLSRLLGRPVDGKWEEGDFNHCLQLLRSEHLDSFLAKKKMLRMHAQDVQNCLCEFDKYMRVKLGEGKPRSKYNGG